MDKHRWIPVTYNLPQRNQRVLVFSPLYPDDNPMRFRIVDGQFVKIMKEATHWLNLDDIEPDGGE